MSKREVKIKIKAAEKKLADYKKRLELLRWVVTMSYPNYAHEESVKVYEEHLGDASLVKKTIIELEKNLEMYNKLLNYYEQRGNN